MLNEWLMQQPCIDIFTKGYEFVRPKVANNHCCTPLEHQKFGGFKAALHTEVELAEAAETTIFPTMVFHGRRRKENPTKTAENIEDAPHVYMYIYISYMYMVIFDDNDYQPV